MLDKLDDIDLAMTSDWCFAELLFRLPREVMTHIAAKLRVHERPWRYLHILQDREDYLDADTFGFLLDHFASALAATDPGDPAPDDTLSALAAIQRVHRPELLQVLRDRRGTTLENELTKRSLALGPQNGNFREYEKHELLEVLMRIGGDAFSTVLDNWLEHTDWQAQIHAVELAQRRATPNTIRILSALSQLDDGGDENKYVLGGYAAAALGSHQCWPAVSSYYLRVGLKSLTIVDECCDTPTKEVDDTALADVLGKFRQAGGPCPGSVIAAALAQRKDLLPEIKQALRTADLQSEVAVACLMALDWLADRDPDIVPTVARFLPVDRQRAITALFVNDSDTAQDTLLAELARDMDLSLARALVPRPRCQASALTDLRQLLAKASEQRMEAAFARILPGLDADALQKMSEDTNVFRNAEEVGYSPYGPVRTPGDKPYALRLVAQKRPQSASRIAQERLRDPATPDPDFYVPLLADFATDKPQALLEALLTPLPTRVVHSIGRHLAELGAISSVMTWLRDKDVERRLGACRIAGFLPPSDELDRQLRTLADDRDYAVAKAAVEAAAQLSHSRTASELADAIAKETEVTHRWTLLDALVAVGDPGDSASPSPLITSILPHVNNSMKRYLRKVLQERRKKQVHDLARADETKRPTG